MPRRHSAPPRRDRRPPAAGAPGRAEAPRRVPGPAAAAEAGDPAERERRRVCVAAITGAHGVRGLVKVKSFTDDPAAFADYGPLEDESGRRRFDLTLKSSVKGQFLAGLEGVADRDAAAALAGTTLWVDRDRLPPPDEAEDEYYHADLIGLAAELPDGTPFGTVRALHDFGAGDVIEIARPGAASVVVPFTRAAVPVVDVAGARVVVDPPPGLLEPTGEEGGPDAAAESHPEQVGPEQVGPEQVGPEQVGPEQPEARPERDTGAAED